MKKVRLLHLFGSERVLTTPLWVAFIISLGSSRAFADPMCQSALENEACAIGNALSVVFFSILFTFVLAPIMAFILKAVFKVSWKQAFAPKRIFLTALAVLSTVLVAHIVSPKNFPVFVIFLIALGITLALNVAFRNRMAD